MKLAMTLKIRKEPSNSVLRISIILVNYTLIVCFYICLLLKDKTNISFSYFNILLEIQISSYYNQLF